VLLSLGDKVSGQEVEEMLQAADVDEDGAINYDEFIPMIMPGLKKAQAEAKAKADAEAKAEAEANAKREARNKKLGL
jgi:membrane protein involved in colicin uptake